MRTQVEEVFDQWLTLMEAAFSTLTLKEFKELEDKIITEIRHRRKTEKKVK